MNIKRWLYLQREGLILGSLWGLVSSFAAVGLVDQVSLTVWQKALILPVYLSGFITNALSLGPSLYILVIPIIIGAGIGALIDRLWEPRQ